MSELQDFEVFIIGFNSVMNVDEIEEITYENFKEFGIDQLERFSTIVLMFDRDSITTTNLNYLVHVVDPKMVTLHFYFSRLSHYYMSVLEVNREGRVEKLPVCGVKSLIFDSVEDEIRTW